MILLQAMRHAVPFVTTGIYNVQRHLIYSNDGISSYLFPMFRKQTDISLNRKQQFMYLPFNIPRRMIYAVTGMKHVVVSQQLSSPAGRLSATFFLGFCLYKPPAKSIMNQTGIALTNSPSSEGLTIVRNTRKTRIINMHVFIHYL